MTEAQAQQLRDLHQVNRDTAQRLREADLRQHVARLESELAASREREGAARAALRAVQKFTDEMAGRVEFEGGGDLRTNQFVVRRLREALSGSSAPQESREGAEQ